MAPSKKIITTSEFVPDHVSETDKDRKEQKVAETAEAIQAKKKFESLKNRFEGKQNSTGAEATTERTTPTNDPALDGTTTPATAESLPDSALVSPVPTPLQLAGKAQQ